MFTLCSSKRWKTDVTWQLPYTAAVLRLWTLREKDMEKQSTKRTNSSNFTGLCHILWGWLSSSRSSFSLCSCKNYSICLFIHSCSTACFSELSIVKYTFTSSHFQLIHKYVKWKTLRLKMLEGRFLVTSLHCESWLFLPQLHFLSSKYSSTGRPFHFFHQA